MIWMASCIKVPPWRGLPWWPIDSHLHPPVVDIFRRHHWLAFFEFLSGYDDDIAHEFSMALNPWARTSATTMVRGLSIKINPEVIRKVTTLPQGVQLRREEKARNTFAKKKRKKRKKKRSRRQRPTLRNTIKKGRNLQDCLLSTLERRKLLPWLP